MTARRTLPTRWAPLLLALCLTACGGGGGGTTPPTTPPTTSTTTTTPTTPTDPVAPTPAPFTVVTGTVSAGIVAQGRLTVYDATTYSGPGSSEAIAVATTTAAGSYEATLPAGFAGPLLIRVTGQADGSATVKDEVFGLTPISEAFELLSVVPSAQVGPPGGRVTAHVTAFTHAMAAYVRHKLGRADIDAAVVAARAQVAARLTDGADPLTTVPTQAAMVALLASASNIANAPTSTLRNDPDACKAKAAPADRIACTLKTVASILQPLAATAPATAAARLNLPPATALSGAAQALDLAVVAANTGLPAADLAAGRTAAATALARTEDAALAAAAAADGGAAVLPLIGVKITRGGQLIILSGPRSGTWQGWNYALSRCLDGQVPCLDFDARASVTPREAMDDPDLVAAANRAAGDLAQAMNALQRTVYAPGRTRYPPLQTFISAVNSGVRQGLAAGSVAAADAAARAALAAAGHPVDAASTAEAGAAPTATEEQVAAGKACFLDSAYDNPTSPSVDEQLDSNCRLAQVHACLHRAGITAYDEQGRANCRIVNGLIDTLIGTWRCRYCNPGYPF